jgi:hypothetical protein
VVILDTFTLAGMADIAPKQAYRVVPPKQAYRVVLVPVEQTSTDGCAPGSVVLTGTPGKGEWERWGPYRCVGAPLAEGVAVALGYVVVAAGPGETVPSG